MGRKDDGCCKSNAGLRKLPFVEDSLQLPGTNLYLDGIDYM